MDNQQVQQYRRFRVGNRVRVTQGDGFQRQFSGRIETINVLRWTPEECARLGIPAEEFVLHLDSGGTAGGYDRIDSIPEDYPE